MVREIFFLIGGTMNSGIPGLLVKAVFGNELTVEFIPVSKRGNGVSLAESDISKTILKEFNERSENISKAGFIDSEYEKFCKSIRFILSEYLCRFWQNITKIDKLLNGMITRQIYSSKKLNMMQNFIECEAHRELFLRYLMAEKRKMSNK